MPYLAHICVEASQQLSKQISQQPALPSKHYTNAFDIYIVMCAGGMANESTAEDLHWFKCAAHHTSGSLRFGSVIISVYLEPKLSKCSRMSLKTI